ncbi:hypothetical protein HYH02_008100 [Chlamydomonas schloesseri]|uniref:Uncharacterized protein n=1 Tax=Chlamydomonas schloesseri TaxID=2026947 RepID=A0A836B3W0_9CHLO|nr:hypothetical protein HYH02_008100 [Chlamydomonas schloesseri]|eukprot:KAG2446946.1 hypothetical protein HYH02_008100 [Chlamydomonas schloesseri]
MSLPRLQHGFRPAAASVSKCCPRVVSVASSTTRPPVGPSLEQAPAPQEQPQPRSPTGLAKLRCVALAAVAAAALVLGPADEAQAARTGGRVGGHRSHAAMSLRKRAAASRPGSGLSATSVSSHSGSTASRRYRVPMSLRLRAAPRSGSYTGSIGSARGVAAGAGAGDSSLVTVASAMQQAVHTVQGSVRPPLLIGDILAYPDLAAGIDLEALPLWASLLGLAGANILGLAVVIGILRNIQDESEPVSVVKVQVAMLERRPQLQSKLAELSGMIQVGQQGAWLILEEAILQLLQHQSHIAYGSVAKQQLASKKKAYAAFGEVAEAEAAKAKREESVVRHIGETQSEDEGDQPAPQGGGGLLGGLLSGMGMGGGPAAKEITVVTLVLATRGKLDIPDRVTDWKGLRHALQQVTGLSSDKIMAVELLWTPRSESDYLTIPQLERDYPDLVPLGPANPHPQGAVGSGSPAR